MKKKPVLPSPNFALDLPLLPKSEGTTVPTAKPAEPLITAVPALPSPHQGEPIETVAPQEETPILERDKGVNDLCESYPYKSRGMDDAEKMHPSYRPPVAKSTPYVAPSLPQEERPPHFWHWCKKTEGKRCPEPYTPSLSARRRSIPAIACSLYYASWACYASKDAHDNATPGCVKTNQIFYEVDQAKVEQLICLLGFCGVDEQAARRLAGEAWKAAKAGQWVVWRSVSARLLRGLGYELGDQEDDGYFDTTGASFGDFAEGEGYKGR